MNCKASDANQTVAYPCLQSSEDEAPTIMHEDEAPTIMREVEPPSLISVPAWPRGNTQAKSTRVARGSSRPVEAFPRQESIHFEPPTFIQQAPHELSPFGASARRLGSSRIAMRAAYAFLGGSAAWAAWSLTYFL